MKIFFKILSREESEGKRRVPLALEPSREWIIWSMCLLATIRGIRNLVSSLSSIEGSTIRGREGVDTGVGKRRVRVAVNLEMPSVRGTVTYCRLAMIN